MPNRQYRWNAADYARNSAAQFEWARDLIDKLRLSGREALLDIGCGDGKVTAVIYESLPLGRVVGIDGSPDMIALASESFPRETHPRLEFRLTDLRDMDFRDEFDVVFSNAALHWVRDHLPVLRRIKRALKPDGRLLFQMGGRGNAEDILSVLDDLMEKEKWTVCFSGFEMPYGFHGREEYGEWLEETGFEARRIDLILKDMIHRDREGLAGWIRTTWLPYLERVPETERETFIDELISAYVKKHPEDENGAIKVGMMRLEVEAVVKGPLPEN